MLAGARARAVVFSLYCAVSLISSRSLSSHCAEMAATVALSVHEIPCWKDNYAYLLVNEASKECAAVDPVEADKVKAKADSLGVTIRAVLTTHHHGDHAGGNEDLRALLAPADLPVYGGDERVLALSHRVGHGDVVSLGALDVHVLSTPCHTRGHVLYYARGADDQHVVFTGDTLFVGGCGRFFEGDGEQMNRALNEVVTSLPHHTRVYCGHEYTVANLEFAASLEPHNAALQQKFAWAQQRRRDGLPTIPSTVADELAINPFMRLDSAELLASLSLSTAMSPAERMTRVREAKNAFKSAL